MSLPDSSILEAAWLMLKQPAKRAGALVLPHAAMVPRQRVRHVAAEGRQVEHAM
jgi:hypothetical protein